MTTKPAGTRFDGAYLFLKCQHCGHTRAEAADPKRNPDPFSFAPRCTSCQELLEVDWEVVEAAQATFALQQQ